MTDVRDGGMAVERTSDARPLVTIHEAAPSATALIAQAIEKGLGVEQLEKLMALHERMEDRQAARDFADAMARFQLECPPIHRNKTADIASNSGAKFAYKYAELDEIARTVNPILTKHGLSYTWNMVADATMLTATCILRHANGHSVESIFTLPHATSAGMSPQQKYAAAYTFAQRKSLSAVLGLTTTDDDPDAAQADPTTVTEDQALYLADLCAEVKALPSKFLAYLDVDSFANVLAVDYARAVALLMERKEKKA